MFKKRWCKNNFNFENNCVVTEEIFSLYRASNINLLYRVLIYVYQFMNGKCVNTNSFSIVQLG